MAPVTRTIGTAEELAATPQQRNDAAYDATAARVFPWTLPFDLGAETARIFLDHLRVSRDDLMDAFRHDTTAATELSIASESLRLSPLALDLITGKSTRQTWEPGA